MDAILHADHPLADAPAIRPAQLRDGVLWTPGPLHRLDFLHRFATAFGIHQHAEGTNLGLDHFLADLAADTQHFSLLPADIPLPPHPTIRSVPLIHPTPLYAWSHCAGRRVGNDRGQRSRGWTAWRERRAAGVRDQAFWRSPHEVRATNVGAKTNSTGPLGRSTTSSPAFRPIW